MDAYRQVENMIRAGRITNSTDVQGWTVLHHAVWDDAPVSIVRLIIKEVKISPNAPDQRGNTSMHDAAYQDVNPELVEYLIEAGGDPNKPNRFGETAVYEAAYRAKPELMAILLRAGGDPNIYTMDRNTPLIAAIKASRDQRIIALLMQYGANYRSKGKNGRNALKVAMEERNDVAAKLILRILTMITVFSAKIRRRPTNTLRAVPKEILRRLNDYL